MPGYALKPAGAILATAPKAGPRSNRQSPERSTDQCGPAPIHSASMCPVCQIAYCTHTRIHLGSNPCSFVHAQSVSQMIQTLVPTNAPNSSFTVSSGPRMAEFQSDGRTSVCHPYGTEGRTYIRFSMRSLFPAPAPSASTVLRRR